MTKDLNGYNDRIFECLKSIYNLQGIILFTYESLKFKAIPGRRKVS